MSQLTVLAVGATGSIGRPVVAEALAAGHTVRALVRDPDRARTLPAGGRLVVGDVTGPASLVAAVEGIDAVVITLGSDGQGRAGQELGASTMRACATCCGPPISRPLAEGRTAGRGEAFGFPHEGSSTGGEFDYLLLKGNVQ